MILEHPPLAVVRLFKLGKYLNLSSLPIVRLGVFIPYARASAMV